MVNSLALFRLETAERFAATARPDAGVTEPDAYGQAIAVELATKALLLANGASDAWTRDHLRHDLVLALNAAEAAGLAPDGDLRRLAEVLNVFYRRHDWHLFEGQPSDVLAGGAAVVARLLHRVRAIIVQG